MKTLSVSLAAALALSLLPCLMPSAHAKPTPTPPAVIVCFGDSITDGNTYAQVIMQSLHEAGIRPPALICSGVGGDTMQMMDDRFEQTVARYKPSLVTVCGGGNDAAQNVPAEDYAKALRSIVAKIKAIGAEVVLLTPSANLSREGKTEEQKEERFQQMQRSLAAYEAVVRTVAAETASRLVENRAPMLKAIEEGKSIFVEDNNHLNYLGQTFMARGIMDALGHKDVALTKNFDPKTAPGLVRQWKLRFAPQEKGQPVPLTAETAAALAPDASWTSVELPDAEVFGDSPELWPEQMRRSGAFMRGSRLTGKGTLAQGVAEITSPKGGEAFIQTGMGIATVWLNGVRIHDQKNAWTGAHLGKERLPVRLKKGTNKLVIEFKNDFFLAVTPVMIWEGLLYR